MTARELRQEIEKMTPKQMFAWKGEFPDEKVFADYQKRMKESFPMMDVK